MKYIVKGIRHTGIVVPDLPAAIEIWKAMGFTVQRVERELPAYTDKMMGLTGSDVTTAKLTAPDGSMIELLHIPTHPHISGITHIAMTVDSLPDGIVSPDGLVRVAYVKWYGGVTLELVEELC